MSERATRCLFCPADYEWELIRHGVATFCCNEHVMTAVMELGQEVSDADA